jgi:hypothetical protein
MEKQFGGVLYVDGHFNDPQCRYQANSTDFELKVNLLNCGIARQFLVSFYYESFRVIKRFCLD